MATIYVTDIQIARRAVKVPARCPGCRKSLTGEHQLREWQLTDERWMSRMARAKVDEGADGNEGNGTVVDYDCGSDSGSGDNVHYGPVAIYCACGFELASGKVEVTGR